MRWLFEFFAVFDWITPSVNIFEHIVNDPTPLQSNSWTFFIPYNRSIGNGWNAFDIEKLMRENGVKMWGTQITNGDLFFTVKLEQAQWAEYLLVRHGIPINEKFLGAPRPKKRQQKKKNEKFFLDEFFDDWFG